jgi:murein DD-endopeptidase MepM/ murein hydrolase activator NlpD
MIKSSQTAGWLMLVQWLGISLATSLPIAVQAATSEEVAPATIAPVEIAPAPAPEAPASLPEPAPLPDPVVVESEPRPAAAAAELEAIETKPVEVAPNQPEVVSDQTYINPQDFSLSEQPDRPATPDVIISERSSGCQAVLQPGSSVPTRLCHTPPAQTAYTARPDQSSSLGQIDQSQSGGSSYNAAYASSAQSGSSSYNTGRNSSISKLYRGSNPLRWLGLSGKNMFFPLSIPAEISSVFGWRLNPVSGTWRMHTGTDLAAPIGTPVLAVQTGEVVAANSLGGYGLAVILAHNQHQHETLYAHLSELLVNPGQTVKQGEVIGLVGSTGNSTGPHLHFEILQRTAEGMVPVDSGPKLTAAMNEMQRAIKVAGAKPAVNPSAN